MTVRIQREASPDTYRVSCDLCPRWVALSVTAEQLGSKIVNHLNRHPVRRRVLAREGATA